MYSTRKTTFDLTDLDSQEMRILRDGAELRRQALRKSPGVSDLTDEHIESSRMGGDGPVSECKRASRLVGQLDDLLAQHQAAEDAAFKARRPATRP